ncbi:hypothetical protein ACVINW_000051 [Bradyrhizobium sp. USDA 4461]
MGYESMDAIAFRMGAFGFRLVITHTSRSLELQNISTAAKARRAMVGAASPSIEARNWIKSYLSRLDVRVLDIPFGNWILREKKKRTRAVFPKAVLL